MKKITIPNNAKCFCSNYTGINYHVGFDNQRDFDKFCNENNIGYHDGAREDIVQSVLHVFTTNKEVFENFGIK
jgi:hypothetical protein